MNVENTKISVVIPVFNNEKTILKIIEILLKQRKINHEIIAVDNGSTDRSVFYLREAAERNKDYIYFFEERKRGAAAARNTGAKKAKSEVILFLGGDIIPDKNLLDRHWETHLQYPKIEIGCLGNVTWDQAVSPTPFMIFLENGGPQNAFGNLAGSDWADPEHYFYGSNISIKKEIFERAGGFDENNFSGYGWEDLELGYRLKKLNFRLKYEPTAVGFHHHFYSLSKVTERSKKVGRGFVKLKKKHPDIKGWDLKSEKWKYYFRGFLFNGMTTSFLTAVAKFGEKKYQWNRLYNRVLSQAFYKGVHEALTKKGSHVEK